MNTCVIEEPITKKWGTGDRQRKVKGQDRANPKNIKTSY